MPQGGFSLLSRGVGAKVHTKSGHDRLDIIYEPQVLFKLIHTIAFHQGRISQQAIFYFQIAQKNPPSQKKLGINLTIFQSCEVKTIKANFALLGNFGTQKKTTRGILHVALRSLKV